jgi:FkbM family methyltransferase
VKQKTALIGSRLGFVGSINVGTSPNGNSLLRLNRNCALGSKGAILELPLDKVIYESVKFKAKWELAESEFLARGLIKACKQQEMKTAFIDIGANTGLITLQAMNLSRTDNEVFLFEPVPRHASAIKQNLRSLAGIHVLEFALSDRNGEAHIFTEESNQGNSSLLNSVVRENGMVRTQVQLVETKQYFKENINSFERYVLKCDTQGLDALILSRLPEYIWKNCECAVIEVWSLDEISEADVDTLLLNCRDFDSISWNPGEMQEDKIGLDEVREFWLSKSGLQKNLFLKNGIQ